MASPFWRRPRFVAGVLVVLAAAGVAAYFLWPRPKKEEALPEPGSAAYEEYVEAFELGTALLDADLYPEALERLTAAVEKVPQEPAAWANRGLLHLRHEELREAAADLNAARERAPDTSPEIEALLGLLAQRRGKLDDAVAHLRRAAEQRPQDLAAKFGLAQMVEKAAAPGSEAEYQRLMEDILSFQPNNLLMLLERARAAAGRRDAEALRTTLARLGRLAADWSGDHAAEARDALEQLKKAADGPLPGDVPEAVVTLRKFLFAQPAWRRDSDAVNPDPEVIMTLGEPLYQFLRLAPRRSSPAAPDLGLTFTPTALGGPALAASKWDVVQPVWLRRRWGRWYRTPPLEVAVLVANAQEVRRADDAGFKLPFPSGDRAVPPSAHGVLGFDWTNGGRPGLLLAGAGGLRFWKQNADGSFADVTAQTGLPADVLNGDYFGAWAADYEMDGDLDVVLAPRAGPPLVLRNNGDGTFKAVRPFAGVESVRAFVWADLDNDGAPDAAFLDAQGRLFVFANERAGQFSARAVPADLGRLVALAALDLDDDGVFDLAALRSDGVVLRISDRGKGRSWETAEVVRWENAPAGLEAGSAALLAVELDNNGGLDLVAAGPRGARVWLNEGPGKFVALPAAIPGRVFAAEGLTDNGRLDLLALDDGRPVRLANRGTRDYHWHAVRVRPVPLEVSKRGDNRINSFAVGSEAEVRVGTLVQKQVIASPRTHFGLGERASVHVQRFVWTNGYAQVEFERPTNQVVQIDQRLKGSCPFLFTWDGQKIAFVTDFLWSSPLGMYVGAQDKGGLQQTREWVKVRGDQLVPRDGRYDVRVHACLWETHFIDHLSLIVVDHPPGTEVFVDERFALKPMTPQVHVTAPPRPVARAWDHTGKDVTELVRAVDGRYLDTCGRGRFQGVTQDHWVEVDLGEGAPDRGPLWLLATGWTHPTDSSINVALAQGSHEGPRPLVLEVPDGQGGWKAAGPALGFPAGKNKTLMIRLDGIDGPGVTRRFRLRTNMEIFWDALRYAEGLDDGLAKQQPLAPDTAVLRYRGTLEMRAADASSPELPDYDRVTPSRQRWRDLIGYHTRYGDVRELLEEADDRYVIANAGDEIALTFTAPPAPHPGWKRDFVWVSDGWEKDGDLNTRFSKTVLPLPAHDLPRYDRPPGRLEDDPVYRRNPDDWRKYHTRYVTPERFERGLRPLGSPP
jgi:tetratricopeptide (TPR) repeat protein